MINSTIQVTIGYDKKILADEPDGNQSAIFHKTTDFPAKPSKGDLISIGPAEYLEVEYVAFLDSAKTPIKVFTKKIKTTKENFKKLTELLKYNGYLK